MHESEKWKGSRSVVSDSSRPHRLQPTRLPRPWDSPGKNTGVGCHFLLQCMKVKSEREVAQSRPTLRDPMDCSLPGSSVHGSFQARVLEWVAIAFSDLLGKSKTVCNLRANCSPQLRQGLPECSTQCPRIWRFSNPTGWEQVLCGPCGAAQHCYSWSLLGALSPASASCLTCTVQYSAEHCWGTLCKCWSFTLCATLSSLVLCSKNPSLLSVPILSAPSS